MAQLATVPDDRSRINSPVKSMKLERAAFLLSAAVLLVLYGYGARAFGWFPNSFLRQAIQQANFHFGEPHYLSPRVYESAGTRVVEATAMAPGLTLLSAHFKNSEWRAGLVLIDRDGRTMHEWLIDPAELFPVSRTAQGFQASRGIHGSYVFPNGDVLLVVDYVGIARLDACGDVIWRMGNDAHHSIARADDGTFWVPISTSAAIPTSAQFPEGYPGLDRPVNHDHLLQISEDGEEIKKISILDVLYRNDLVRFLPKARTVVPSDLMHVNDVEPLSEQLSHEHPLFDVDDLLVSIRASDLVLVVDPETEVVKWHSSDPFVQQHDPDFLPGGWIGVFDNRRDGTSRGTQLGGSRIVAVQPHSDSTKVIFPVAEAEPFYTPILGKWQMLRNGNLLLTEGRPGRVVEVAPDGKTVWEWIHQPYDVSRAVEVTEGTRYDFTPEEVAAWACGSRS